MHSVKANAQKPKIVLVMQFYDPEPVYKGQGFAEAIADAGYEVEVVTGFPNYPGGRVYDGYQIRPIRRSKENGIAITRLALYPSHNTSKVGRILNYITFMLSAFVYLTFFARRGQLVYAYHPPLTVGIAATVSGIIRRIPVVVDIHDLWPDTLPATGMINNPKILWLIERCCDWMYRNTRHIILHSDGFRDALIKRGVPAEKMTTVIGWTHEPKDPIQPVTIPADMSDLEGLKLLYAGNMGPAQGLESVLDAAHILEREGHRATATFCFLGSGLALDSLREKAEKLSLTNVIFLPRVKQPDVAAYLSASDVLLMHLRDTSLFSLNIPSKMQAYMLAGKPILMGVRGEAEKILRDAGAGISVPPENSRAIADAVISFSKMSSDERKKLGESAGKYYWSELCMEKGMTKFLSIFEKARRF